MYPTTVANRADGDYDYCALEDSDVISLVYARARQLEMDILQAQLDGVEYARSDPALIEPLIGRSERVLDVLYTVSSGTLGRKLNP